MYRELADEDGLDTDDFHRELAGEDDDVVVDSDDFRAGCEVKLLQLSGKDLMQHSGRTEREVEP